MCNVVCYRVFSIHQHSETILLLFTEFLYVLWTHAWWYLEIKMILISNQPQPNNYITLYLFLKKNLNQTYAFNAFSNSKGNIIANIILWYLL